MRNIFLMVLVSIIVSVGCIRRDKQQHWKYPAFETTSVVNEYFGKKVVDDYQALEHLDSTEVKEWFEAQHEFYQSVINNISGKDSLISEIKAFETSSNIRASLPRVSNNRIFYVWFYIKDNYQTLFSTDINGANRIELFSTKELNKSGDKIYIIDYFEPSYTADYVALGISSGGDEMATIHVLDVNARKLLNEKIERCMYGNPYWIPGKKGFFYNQIRQPENENDIAVYENSVVKYHTVGTDPKTDGHIFSSNLNKGLGLEGIDFPYLLTFPSSEKVLALVYHGSHPYYQLYWTSVNDLLSNREKASWKILVNREDKVNGYALFGDKVFLLHFKNSSSGEVEEVNLLNPEERKIVYRGNDRILQDLVQNNNKLYIKYLKDGINGLIEVDPDDLQTNNVALPLEGSLKITEEKSFLNADFLFIGLNSWTKEFGLYKYEDQKIRLTNIRPQGKYGNPSDLVSKEILVPSYDGELVPVSVIYSEDTDLNGKNPVILSAYGAYGVSLDPMYDASKLAWFNRGGIYAIAHVRGGGEKGDAWHKGGYKATKPNSWKDFIACAEYLIENKYTSPEVLTVQGASAGGITIGRAITERPDLFKAAVIKVGELNTIRAENSKNTFGITEFGSVKDSTEFNYLFEADVYHHIKPNVKYPSLLITAAMNDARVDPWRPAKVVAKMQAIDNPSNVVLFRISDEGHFGEVDFSKETAEIYSFLFWQVGHPEFEYKTSK